MSETNDNDSAARSTEDDDRPRRRFNPRLAVIYTVGAFVIVLLFAAGLAFFGGGSSSSEGSGGKAQNAKTMQLGANEGSFTATTLPDSGLLTMSGKVTDLASVTNGKPTMINMFSRACTACLTEMPALEKLHHALGDRAQIVGVDLGDSQKITEEFVRKTGVTYEIVRDPKLLLVSTLNITAQPMTLWVDAQGRITGHRYGAMTPTEMRLGTKDHLGISVPSA